MRRYIVYPSLLFCVHLMSYDITHTCSKHNESENLTCLANYVNYMSCIWYSGTHSGNGSFTLSAKNEDVNARKCDLVSVSYEENSYSCNITNLLFSEMDNYEIMVHDSASNTLAEIKQFQPMCNIRLDPPSGLSYSFNDSIYWIIWTGLKDLNAVTLLQYELQLKKEAASWQETTPPQLYNPDMYVKISSHFEKGSIYHVRIRWRTDDQDYYRSQWSEWSSELKIHTLEKDRSPANITHVIVIIAVLMTTLIVLYLVLFSNLSTRIKIPFLHDVPTAAEFFQDLYLVHNGNFQDWTKYPNKDVKIKKERFSCTTTDTDPHSSTVLCFQKDIISPIKLEVPPPKKDAPLLHETSAPESSYDSQQQKNISLNEVYSSFSPDFPIFNDNDAENNSGYKMDSPADYMSNDGSYIVNPQDVVI